MLKHSCNAKKKKGGQKVCPLYGEGAMTDETCQKWFAKFHAGGFTLDSTLWSGRVVDDNPIQTLTENINVYHPGDSHYSQSIQIKP